MTLYYPQTALEWIQLGFWFSVALSLLFTIIQIAYYIIKALIGVNNK